MDLEERVKFLERELERLRRELADLRAAQSRVETLSYQVANG